MRVDVADAESVEAAAAEIGGRVGAVDLVVSNVGVQLFGAVERFTDDEWRWVLDVNVVGSARVARAFLPLLRQAERPRLAFTTSSSVPSGMLSRHLETSEAAQPGAIRRPIGEADDFEAMIASNPVMASAVVSPEDAARHVIDAVLADEPYVVTHGDLVDAITDRSAALARAAESARER
jgi:hypothetical protein